ncbi:MAG: hypothetical protein LAT81_14440 [Oceanicaulis sp.]|nr:hypothetical protein [Oceanicaulis sp.]
MMRDLEFLMEDDRKVIATHLRAECGVRYWEDGTINGKDDTEGTLIPCREGDTWCPVIELKTGYIQNWPEGVVADLHYKVCDDGAYHLMAEGEKITSITGYVPKIMRPGKNGSDDYVVMNIDGSGKIENWIVLLEDFRK